MAETSGGKKRGRKPLPPGEGKRLPVSFRTTRELRDRLDKACDVSGRSLAQEVEHRMDQSFLVDDSFQFLASTDAKAAAVFRTALHAKAMIEELMGSSVWEDLEAHSAFSVAMAEILDANQPEPSKGYGRRLAAYERAKEKTLRDWRRKVGEGLFIDSEAGPPPETGLSPLQKSQRTGTVVAQTILDNHRKILARLLMEEEEA